MNASILISDWDVIVGIQCFSYIHFFQGPYWILRDLRSLASMSHESFIFYLLLAWKRHWPNIWCWWFRLHGSHVTSLSRCMGTEVVSSLLILQKFLWRKSNCFKCIPFTKGQWCFCDASSKCWTNTRLANHLRCHGPLTRYVKLQVAYAPGMPGTFSHHCGLAIWKCITAHMPWCMPG